MRTIVLFFLLPVIAAPVHAQNLLTELCVLPSAVSETSGLENSPDGCFWTHNDSGNPAELFCVDTNGSIIKELQVIGDLNTDWEELAKDGQGNLYIGNFGNNTLDRTDLRIVKIPGIDTCTATAQVSDTISFSYPDQYDFPPNGAYGNFDMEAFFWMQDTLHLFSKDRSNPSTGYTKHYKLPAQTGNYTALLADSLETGTTSFIFSITAADISEDGNTVALLNSERIWLCTDFEGSDFFGGQVSTLALGSITQKEGLCFRDGFIYLTDELAYGFGGKMYRVNPGLFLPVGAGHQALDLRPVYDDHYYSFEMLSLPDNSMVKWTLYTADGALVKQGVSEGTLTRDELTSRIGLFVLHLSVDGEPVAMLIRL